MLNRKDGLLPPSCLRLFDKKPCQEQGGEASQAVPFFSLEDRGFYFQNTCTLVRHLTKLS